ncbi:sigma-70 family RNA polymerase sigma factor [Oscillatoria sp. FACHB-1407]|uniref:sigma-70 family RNA polymerase sigma factor n=1 Tax=Oscillatoria sp. FACHB-1407 TaxID=2692847 RepID=UPI0016890CB0|nr:sigma-70 family RNA polymerase sigma factor [Oscillatoria sp. FACHB-1407]MBD2459786.1 sigma-70 family RNA polymerase sigma factor [Oscillatoria sp. FACHB-1407]
MRHRQNLIELFSTFVQFAGDRFGGWLADPRLERSMKASLQQAATTVRELSEGIWALHWHEHWRKNPTGSAANHLSAYLQESCYWAAYKMINRFTSTPYKLSDCFQIAIADLPKILNRFSAAQGSSLKAYASAAFGTAIRDTLRQRQEADICSDWGLLRKLSQKRFADALSKAGLPNHKVAQYSLAWNCFKTIYVPSKGTATRQLSRPERSTWEAIADLYNRDRLQLEDPGLPCSPEVMEQWLSFCAERARAYLYPSALSLNAPKPGLDEGELQDDLPDPMADAPLSLLIAAEEAEVRDSQRSQINTVLLNQLEQMDTQAQQLLQLYYGDELTQQQIAQELGIKQYAVSRRLSKTREILLLALASWSQQTLHISLSSDVVSNMNDVLEEWLYSYFHNAPPFTKGV